MRTSSSIAFTKMHGLGNDFVIIDALKHPVNLNQIHIRHLANRHLGIGFDQLLIIENSQQADFFCRIYNADGSEALQCGNGLRCIARYIEVNHLHPDFQFQLETKSGVYPATIHQDGTISIGMGTPTIQSKLTEINIAHHKLIGSLLSLGNPHAVFKVPEINDVDIVGLGHAIGQLERFQNGINVGFMQVINDQKIKLRTVERGAGITNACGSNACAAVIAGHLNGWLHSTVEVLYQFGSLFVTHTQDNNQVMLRGPATTVFTGNVNVGDLV